MVVAEETGLLVPPADSEALAGAISRLCGDAYLRKRMGIAGRDLVEAQFSLRAMTDKIEALYHAEYEIRRGSRELEGVLAS